VDRSLGDRVVGRRGRVPSSLRCRSVLEVAVLKIVAVLLVVWLVLTVLGAVVEGLFWLTVVGAVLFLATAGYGYLKRGSGPRQIR
jgi:hypothetical protein